MKTDAINTMTKQAASIKNCMVCTANFFDGAQKFICLKPDCKAPVMCRICWLKHHMAHDREPL